MLGSVLQFNCLLTTQEGYKRAIGSIHSKYPHLAPGSLSLHRFLDSLVGLALPATVTPPYVHRPPSIQRCRIRVERGIDTRNYPCTTQTEPLFPSQLGMDCC